MKGLSKWLLVGALLPCQAMGQQIEVAGIGQWADNYCAPSGVRYGWFWDAKVWIDLQVSEGGFGKDVGVRWTIDDWQTSHETLGKYDGPGAEGRELWSIDFTAAKMESCFWCKPQNVVLEYALFSRNGSAEIWENNEGLNYQLPIESIYHEIEIPPPEADDSEDEVACPG
ncbi:carbohydrate-binding protein [Pseudobacteriovorax antillogorgiicola]|uniref:Carbohydrate/starch-binding module (Family 21) n=1 Tax=Pseudobacteriovorax antillogorgiicola TaxID=1513793 RepID=A0A1Y6BLL5_9BACT|nr:carbohydrate-binding protein [Pseudobacteriovorax antillogorgiicola]TCS56309.1 carbohydrate/starch-binding protein with CBM21 domain [Pseudobacteriovorax antillogorgiicola]SMF07246.1 Carbohydrate/starch-binding module (family 21) [Pseudobacteriovorax antillogorgiicola]